MTQGRTIRGVIAPLLLTLVIACFLAESREQPPQFDDAYISYRYARNLVEGNGLVYNVGERVEGFSNLLWTLLIAVGMALGLRATDIAYILGIASGVTALVAAFVYASVGTGRPRRWIAVVAPALLFSWIGFPVWTLSGLETPLFAAAVAAALAAEAYGRIGLATAAAIIATLARPEGPLVAAVVLGVNLLRGPPQRRWRVIGWSIAYAAVLALLTAFRLSYYGSPVPNTYFAKIGSNVWLHGMGDLGRFLFGGALPILVPVVWAVWRDRASRVGALWCVAMGVYIVSIGGDAFPHHRFWVPVYLVLAVLAARALIVQRPSERSRLDVLPLWIFVIATWVWGYLSPVLALLIIAACTVAAVVGVWGARLRRVTAPVAFATVAFLLYWLQAPWLDDDAFAQRSAAIAALSGSPAPQGVESTWRVKRMLSMLLRGRSVTRNELLEITRRGNRDHLRRAEASARRVEARRRQGENVDLVAAMAIGKFGYDLRIPILDMLGLVDAHIARSPIYRPSQPVLWLAGHMRTDADYVFSRRPDYIFVQREWSSPLRLPVHDDLWSNPTLGRDYEWDEEMQAYRRKR